MFYLPHAKSKQAKWQTNPASHTSGRGNWDIFFVLSTLKHSQAHADMHTHTHTQAQTECMCHTHVDALLTANLPQNGRIKRCEALGSTLRAFGKVSIVFILSISSALFSSLSLQLPHLLALSLSLLYSVYILLSLSFDVAIAYISAQ